MMSGRLASAIEAWDNAAEFRASIPTMAHYLRHLGYQTALCGKMHFVGPDLLHGFEERLTPEIYSSDFMTLPDWSESERDDYASDAYEALCEAGPAPRTVQMDYDEEVAFQAKRKLYDLARTDDPRSFLLVVSFTHPHDPYICRQEFWDLFPDAEIDMPRVGRFAESDLDASQSAHLPPLQSVEAGDYRRPCQKGEASLLRIAGLRGSLPGGTARRGA